jgi:U3 small nucleolar RNA-associated protein 12
VCFRSSQFEKIQTLEGHHGEVWALAVSNRGNFVVTGSHDKSIRIWEKLDDPLFLEEERERDLEKLYDANLAETMNRDDDRVGIGRGADGGDSGGSQEQIEVAQVTKQTTETLMAGEKIMEAIDIADADLALLAEYETAKSGLNEIQISALPAPARNPLLAMQGLEAETYVLQVIEKVSSTALQDALLVLPFNNVLSLMKYLNEWARMVRIRPSGALTEARVNPNTNRGGTLFLYRASFSSSSAPIIIRSSQTA